ncbi:MAG: resA 11 [Gemmataceae bacterium]|nr:resA 11 [Gemmataceae bacterium]
MATSRFTMRVLATLTLWAGFGLTASAQLPALTVDKAFEAQPRQPGVTVPTPAADQIGRYRVEAIPDPKTPGANMGYVVRDPDNRPVRQFVSYDGKSFNIIAFYVNGQEAYREVYPPKPTDPYQFRWLGPNGGKWGLDRDRDGKVDEWAVISPEEASQELLQAVLTKDAKRLDALLPTKENLESLGLPPADVKQIQDRAVKAAQKLTEAADKLKLSPAAQWVHLELGPPQTTASDAFGGRDDKMVHRNGTVLIQDGKETKFLQTGELILVGRSWKVIDGPTAGPAGPDMVAGQSGNGPQITPEIQHLVAQLDELDKMAPALVGPVAMAEYYTKRAAILEQIVQKLPADKQSDWARLLIDSLAAAAEGGKADNPAHLRLKQLRDTFIARGAGEPLGPYVSFRLLVAENGIALANEKNVQAVQEKWRTGLEAFINAHPKSEDAGEAVLRLAMAYDFLGKEGEPKAKTWCDYLIKNYPQHHHVAKAAGIVRRLECEGKPFELQGTVLTTGQPFAAAQLAGKAVVVFYWASWSSTLAEDAKKLKDLAATYGPKGLEIVTVCLDDDAKTAAQTLQGAPLPGTHLHVKGGLDGSPLATGYGITVVPHIIVAGKDGKVVNRNAQITTLEDDVKRLTQ